MNAEPPSKPSSLVEVASERSDGNSGGNSTPADRQEVGGCLRPAFSTPFKDSAGKSLPSLSRPSRSEVWRSRPGCDCEDRPNRNKNREDKSERFPSHVSLLRQHVPLA